MKPKEYKENLKVLLSEEMLQRRIQELGAKITQDYKGKKLVIVCILKGAFMFCADLIRHIYLPLSCDFFGVASYGDSTKSSGILQTTLDVSSSLEGKDVLIVEDVVDTGLTIEHLQRYFSSKNPKSIKLCSLLLKPKSLKQKIQVDYCGFEIGDEFVVGYGMDAAQHYRNLKYLAVLT